MSSKLDKTSDVLGFTSLCMPFLALMSGQLSQFWPALHVLQYAPLAGVALGVVSWKSFLGKVGTVVNLLLTILVWGSIFAIRHDSGFLR
jgi:hypothetical protein